MMENVKRMREIHRASRQRQEDNKQNRGPIKTGGRPDSCISTQRGKLEREVCSIYIVPYVSCSVILK